MGCFNEAYFNWDKKPKRDTTLGKPPAPPFHSFWSSEKPTTENQELEQEIERLNKELQDTKEHLGEYLYEQEEENKRLNNIIKHTDSWVDRTIEIIKQQPSEDDIWILERLNGIKQCLKGDGSNE